MQLASHCCCCPGREAWCEMVFRNSTQQCVSATWGPLPGGAPPAVAPPAAPGGLSATPPSPTRRSLCIMPGGSITGGCHNPGCWQDIREHGILHADQQQRAVSQLPASVLRIRQRRQAFLRRQRVCLVDPPHRALLREVLLAKHGTPARRRTSWRVPQCVASGVGCRRHPASAGASLCASLCGKHNLPGRFRHSEPPDSPSVHLELRLLYGPRRIVVQHNLVACARKGSRVHAGDASMGAATWVGHAWVTGHLVAACAPAGDA